ncbi:hypothetical protein C8R48DRAFT_733168, partial [Suillus tomentosus]
MFVLRTYALWNNNRFVLAATVCIAVAFVVIAAIDIVFATVATSHGCSRLPQLLFSHIHPTFTVTTSTILPGCYRTSRRIQLSMPFLLLFVFELGLISLTFVRAIQSWKTVNGPLYTVLVKHDILYYACGLFLAAINVIMQMLFSQYAYHSVFDEYALPDSAANSY